MAQICMGADHPVLGYLPYSSGRQRRGIPKATITLTIYHIRFMLPGFRYLLGWLGLVPRWRKQVFAFEPVALDFWFRTRGRAPRVQGGG